jgi:hypothetical protein
LLALATAEHRDIGRQYLRKLFRRITDDLDAERLEARDHVRQLRRRDRPGLRGNDAL